jgi:hypothetical protein
MEVERVGQLVHVLKENRSFPPDKEFVGKARIKSVEEYQRMCDHAAGDLEGFWDEYAHELHWFMPYRDVLQWNEPFAKWFVGGYTNASYNCLDMHLSMPRLQKAAIIWEGEPGDVRVLTYQMLHTEVCKFANVLIKLGIKHGDVVSIYMPMVPELPVAMLACARIGAVHSVIFSGFSADAVAFPHRIFGESGRAIGAEQFLDLVVRPLLQARGALLFPAGAACPVNDRPGEEDLLDRYAQIAKDFDRFRNDLLDQGICQES